jgi:hypothetical protein
MTRETLTKAIRIGIKRGGSPDQIADAIETALELELADASPVDSQPEAPPARTPLSPPPSPASIVPAPPEEPIVHRRAEPIALDKPQPVELRKGLIVLAEEGDIDKEIAAMAKPAAPVRIRSLSTASQRSPQMRMQDAVQFWTEHAPEFLDVMADGRDKPVRLERNIAALPCTGGQASKTGDLVRLSYKHPNVGAEMEVFHGVTVSEMRAGINVDAVMGKIIADAKKMYRPRPVSIEPVKPVPVPLTYNVNNGRVDERGIQEGAPADQDRFAAVVRSGKAAVEEMVKEIKKS